MIEIFVSRARCFIGLYLLCSFWHHIIQMLFTRKSVVPLFGYVACESIRFFGSCFTRREKTVCVCESSTHDFCVLPLRICKVKCDWLIRADVTEIVLMARDRRRYFSAETSDSRKYFCARRLPWGQRNWKVATSFPGSLSSASLVVGREEREPRNEVVIAIGPSGVQFRE